MTFDELSNRYDGIIPRDEKAISFFGSYYVYYTAFLDAAERNFAKRCGRTVQSLSAWRMTDRYDGITIEKMTDRLQIVLRHARDKAVYTLDLSAASTDLSKVAVTAAPINTA